MGGVGGAVPSYASSGGPYGYRGRRSSVSTPLAGPMGGSPFMGGGSPYLGPGAAGAGAYSPGASPVLGPAGGIGGPPLGAGAAGMAGGIPRSISPMPGAGLGAGAGMGMGMGGAPGLGGAYAAGMGLGGAGAGMGAGMGLGGGAGMGAYGDPANVNLQSVPPGSTIIVKHGRRRRHSDVSSRRRSPSIDVIQTGGAGIGGGYGGGGYGGGGYGGAPQGYGAGPGGPGGFAPAPPGPPPGADPQCVCSELSLSAACVLIVAVCAQALELVLVCRYGPIRAHHRGGTS